MLWWCLGGHYRSSSSSVVAGKDIVTILCPWWSTLPSMLAPIPWNTLMVTLHWWGERREEEMVRLDRYAQWTAEILDEGEFPLIINVWTIKTANLSIYLVRLKLIQFNFRNKLDYTRNSFEVGVTYCRFQRKPCLKNKMNRERIFVNYFVKMSNKK